MYLKRIDIKGFKSFADTTEISLFPGVNIVVGPNGCGKSNIVDAIRWVLGEANVRHLRGQKSEDIIFNGSDKKRALGMAAVEMTLDNSDNFLPLDFNEITLGRKFFRSGESEFYMNKSRVRMRDIAELFTGTGLGKKGYSIISQGELEQVLNGQPLDRRLIIEEAAGIIKYRQQRDEVNKRLSATAHDLLRLNDILEELRQRKGELLKKAEKAQLFLQINGNYQDLERKVIQYELSKNKQDLEQKHNEILDRQDVLKGLSLQLANSETTLLQEEERLTYKQNLLTRLREDIHGVESRRNAVEGEIKLSEERIKNRRERISLAEIDGKKYSGMLENIARDLKSSQQGLDAEEGIYQEKLAAYKALHAEVEAMELNIENYHKNFESKKSEVFDTIKQESQVKNQLIETEEMLRKSRDRKERLNIHIEDLAEKIKKQRQNRIELEQEKKRESIAIEKIKLELDGLQAEKSKLDQISQEIEQKYRELEQKSIKTDNSILSLRDMQKRMVGYSPGVKLILNSAGQSRLPGIIGLMGELIDVPPGMELAVDMAAGSGLQNIVVEREEHARAAIEFLKRQGQGRVTFLPLDILKVARIPPAIMEELPRLEGVLGRGSQLVKFEKRFEKAVEYLLGRVLVVQNLEKGIKVFKTLNYPLRIVSLEGELINVSGAMTGGSGSSSGNSPLQRRGEEKRLLQVQAENRLAGEENREMARNTALKLEELEKQINLNRDRLREDQFGYEMLVKQLIALEDDLLAWDEERGKYLKQMEQLENEAVILENSILELQTRQQQMHSEGELAARELDKCKENFDLLKRDYEVRKERLSAYSDQLEMKKREIQNISKNIDQFQQVKNSYLQSQQESGDLRERLLEEISIELKRIESLEGEFNGFEKDSQKLSEEIAGVQTAAEVHRSNINGIRSEMIPARQELAKLENQIRNLEVNVARLETESEGIIARWLEKFDEQPAGDPEPTPAAEIRDCRKKIELLRRQLEDIGPVDLESIRECEEVTARFDFMQKQYDDLITARDSLESLLKETEKIMLRNFAGFLILANESFSQTFNEIFNGGEAFLKLETDVDRLEAGVNIEVKMPGKKHQSLNLLSGGERALTCIAFIFSLLRLKPAPFCLLDEIDASLDEVNLSRFSKFIKVMAKNIQFIIITHRQATIEAGENIYGITMPEEGISSVFSINLVEAESLAG